MSRACCVAESDRSMISVERMACLPQYCVAYRELNELVSSEIGRVFGCHLRMTLTVDK
jgi:hypothetical protein